MELKDSKKFIFAGRAVFTLVGKKDRFTYSFLKKAGGLYHVYVKSDSWVYLGFIRNFIARLSGEHHINARVAILYTLPYISSSTNHPDIQIFHEGRCGKCGRPLTDPESILCGLGPKCKQS